MRDAPPTRYKVVERGRRLEVLDTWNNDAPVKPMAGAPSPPARLDKAPSPRSVRPGPSPHSPGTLTTSAWYDAQGPRQIALTAAGEAKLKGLKAVGGITAMFAALAIWFFWPLMLLAVFALLRGDARTALRRGAATFIDRINDA